MTSLVVLALMEDQHAFKGSDFQHQPAPANATDLPAATISQQFLQNLQCHVYKNELRILFNMIFSQIKLTVQQKRAYVVSLFVHKKMTGEGLRTITILRLLLELLFQQADIYFGYTGFSILPCLVHPLGI